jgi:hypothetical protein
MNVPATPACDAAPARTAAVVAGLLLLLGSASCCAGGAETGMSLHVCAEVHAVRAVQLQEPSRALLQR